MESAGTGHGREIRRRESRYVSLDMFLSGVKLSRRFMCLFISPLARGIHHKWVHIDGGVHISNLHGGQSFGGFCQSFSLLTPSFVLSLSFSLCLSRSVAASSFFVFGKKFATTGPPREHYRMSP